MDPLTEAPAWRLAPQTYDPAIPLDQLAEHPANPNVGAKGVIAESLDEHGFYGAVLVQKSTGRIIAGNHRLQLAQERGATSIPGFWLDVADDEAEAILAVDNESTRLGKYDETKLLTLLEGRTSLAGTGFDAARLSALSALVHRRGAFGEPTNPADEWEGMPDFDQPGRESAAQVVIHFPTEEAAEKFFTLMGQPRSAWFWWPAADGFRSLDISQEEIMAGVAEGLERTRPAQFPCPAEDGGCGAAPGAPCTGFGHGEPVDSFHKARRAQVPQ